MSELEEAIEPLRSHREQTAILLDVDGTLAQVAARPEEAEVPAETRALLQELTVQYGLVGCVSGRQALDARALVGLPNLHYVGNHGAELLLPNDETPTINAELTEWIAPIQDFTRGEFSEDLVKLSVRLEEKGPISALHYRGSQDEETSIEALRELARRAGKAGLRTQWGRKVLEIRPPLSFDKGSGIEQLLREGLFTYVLYAGDDNTDLDAFRKLTVLKQGGHLNYSLTIGVTSSESPATIAAEADLVLAGPEGVSDLLRKLSE